MRILPALILAGLPFSSALAQSGASGSESYVSTARNLPASGARASSESVDAETELAFTTAGAEATSESFSFQGGAVWTGNELVPSAPIVFGVVDPKGTSAGGESELVLGFGFQAPGAGATSVTLGSASASGVAVLSDTQVSLVAPAGVNPFGNSLGRVSLEVANANGAAALDDAYLYTPALWFEDEPVIGETFSIRMTGSPGDLQDLYFGLSFPGVAAPIAGFTGSWELLQFFASPVPSGPAPDGETTWSLPVPLNPSFVGASLEWQAIAITSFSPLTGALTNSIVTTISN